MTDQLRIAVAPAPERTPKRGRLRLVLIILAAVCGLALYRSPVLRLQGAEVVGVQHLSAERILEAAGLTAGAPRWGNPGYRIEERLRQEPWVKSVKAEWTWNRLRIDVAERSAVALLPYQGKWVLLDETGMILELAESPTALKLPVVAGVITTKALRGQQLSHQGLSDALLVISYLAAPLGDQVSQVDIKPDLELVFFMVGGAQVQWGAVPDDPKVREQAVTDKIKLFGDVWPGLKKRGPTCSIDMRVQGWAYPQGCK